MTLEDLIAEEEALRQEAFYYANAADKLNNKADAVAAEISCLKFGIIKGVRVRITLSTLVAEGNLVSVQGDGWQMLWAIRLSEANVTYKDSMGDQSFEFGFATYQITDKSQITVKTIDNE